MPKIVIDEEDIFNFVFSPADLSAEKYEYIGSHHSLFTGEIEFCKKLQANLDKPLPDSMKKKIKDRLDSQNQKIFHLHPVKIPATPAHSFTTLAAASEQPLSLSLTYKDNSDRILIRLLIKENKQELYLFSQEIIPGDKIRCTFLPGNETSEFIMQKQAMAVNLPEKIEEILIEPM